MDIHELFDFWSMQLTSSIKPLENNFAWSCRGDRGRGGSIDR